MSDASLPSVTFSSFVISLASSAMVHLGETPDPSTGTKAIDLAMARHSIDLLGLLDDKTEGNLTEEEGKLLTSLLAELRTKFVDVAKAQGQG